MGGCEAEVLVRGKDIKVSQVAAAPLLSDLVFFGECVGWLFLDFSTR